MTNVSMRHADARRTEVAPGRTALAARWLLSRARRYPASVWLLWIVGVVALLLTARFAIADPAFLVLAVDPELVAALVVTAVALFREDLWQVLGPCLTVARDAVRRGLQLGKRRVDLGDSSPYLNPVPWRQDD